MSNVNNQFKELIYEAIHNHFHDKTETEMILKDWLYGICEQADEYEAKAKAYDAIAINIKALRKHMLDSGRSVNAKTIETENTLKHIEKIIEGVSYYHD